jgi:hypothetical protein
MQRGVTIVQQPAWPVMPLTVRPPADPPHSGPGYDTWFPSATAAMPGCAGFPGETSSPAVEMVCGRAAMRANRWRHRWYHTTVKKTTLYLPADLKARVKRAAAERGMSEAEIIRESIRLSVGAVRPRPRAALYSTGQPIARRAEELLSGFGER